MGINPITQQIRATMLLVVAGICASPVAQAAEALPSLIVTAGRIAEDPARVSADVTVISEQEIKKAQVTTVADLLRRQPGLQLSANGGTGKTTSLYMRGGNSGHTLVLVDGVRVGAASTGAFDWALMSPEDIERIEIVRGPQSSLYGGDAMSGVIQIFTKTGTGKPAVHIRGEGGSLATSRGSMQVTGANEAGVSYALTAAGMRTAGVSVAAAGSERDPYRQSQISARMQMELGEGELSLTARQSEGRNGLDGGWVLADTLNWYANTRQSVYSIKASYPLLDHWESSLQISRSADDLTGNDPGNAANNADIHTTIDQISWQNQLDLDPFGLLFGVDSHADRAVNQLAPYNKTLRQHAGFAALSWHHELLDVNASVRHDRNSGFTNKTTWHAGAALHPLQGLKLMANYGTGFKAPSINDLYWPGAGNANLKPESSKGWDAGIEYAWQGDALQAKLGATWFDQSYNDLIAWAPITPGSFTWIPSNVNKARNRGLELSAKTTVAGIYLQASWNYLLARDTGSGTWLARRPKESANILIGFDLGPVNVEANMAMVGPRFSSPNNAAYLAGYRKSDLRLRYRITPDWELTTRMENVENKKYQEAAGYGINGRVWYAGLGATF